MTISADDFTAIFPEFSNPLTFPFASVNFWLTQAYGFLNARRFGTQLDLAVALYVAHNMTLAARNALAVSSTNGLPGMASGPMQSKSGGGVSASYDTGSTAAAGADFYNSTSYGQRLYQLMQTFCGGPVYAAPRRFGGFGFGLYR